MRNAGDLAEARLVRTVTTSAGPCWVWQTPLGWRWAPCTVEEPEEFSEHYPSPGAAERQAQLWAVDQAEEEGWSE